MTWSAVITAYNSGSVIADAVASLMNLPSCELPLDVIVVDNNSSDDTIDVLTPWLGRITLIRNTTNAGLSRANNQGAGAAAGKSVFFLNPDVLLMPGAVTALLRFQESHPRAALLGPSMIDSEGNLQSSARTWPTPDVIASRRTILGRTSRGRRTGEDHMNRFHRAEGAVRPHWLIGAALWLTPAGRKTVGLMSEKYFLYFEDVEWCWRAWKRNMEVWYVPGAQIRHVCRRESASGGGMLKLHLRSMMRFLLTHPAALVGKGPGGLDN